MKLLRIGSSGAERPAVLIGREVLDVSSSVQDYDASFWEQGGVDQLRDLPRASTTTIDLNQVDRIGPPVVRPQKIICIGLNYRDHIAEVGAETPAEPIVFMKAPNTLVGPNDDVILPPNALKVDYEVELGVVIGKRSQYLKDEEEALRAIGGWVLSNDISERGWQLDRGGQWVKGKSFETFNPLGPWLVTPDELNMETGLAMKLSVNGELRQNSTTREMLFSPSFLVWYLSQFLVLEPGDIVNTGTPAGVVLGSSRQYLRVGDVIEASIDQLGVQRLVCRGA